MFTLQSLKANLCLEDQERSDEIVHHPADAFFVGASRASVAQETQVDQLSDQQ
jgi:hypothetical protein